MCGRYICVEDEQVDIGVLYRELRVTHPGVDLKSGEICPTDTVPLLCYGGAGRPLCPAPGTWGFSGTRGKSDGKKPTLLINARAETAATRQLFRESFARRRCVIPTLGYYEWSQARVKHRFCGAGAITYLAGLWQPAEGGVRFVVLTTEANASVIAVHHRMPVILSADVLGRWVQDSEFAAMYVRREMPELRVEAV